MRAALGGRWAAVAGVASLTAASAVLRTEGLRVRLWLDEAISVGIASQPLGAIPGLMRRDGSPPLYYLLLHGWMEVAGQSEAALHLLSLAFGVAVVPVAYWAGRSLFGRRVGWMAAAMAAANPYITRYSVEVRMYTLLVLLSLVCVTCFVHAFVHGRRRWLPAFVLSLALTMYTHNWGLFLALSLGVTALALGFRNGRSSVARTAAPFAVVGVLYAPWIPTLLAQARDVGAPWSKSPGLREVIWSAGAVFGDERALVALLLTVAALGVEPRLRPRPGQWVAPAALGAVAVLTIASGWLAAQITHAWTERYFGVFLAPLLLAGAWVFRRARAQGLVAFVLVLLFWTHPLGRLTGLRPAPKPHHKSNVWSVARRVAPMLKAGDLVISTQIEMVPLLSYYFNPDEKPMAFATPTGRVSDPMLVDWRDATARLDAARPESGLLPLMEAVDPGRRIVLTCPAHSTLELPRRWFAIMGARCAEWTAVLGSDPRFQIAFGPYPAPDVRPRGVSIVATVYEKVVGGPAPPADR